MRTKECTLKAKRCLGIPTPAGIVRAMAPPGTEEEKKNQQCCLNTNFLTEQLRKIRTYIS